MPRCEERQTVMKETFEEMASYRISPRLKGKYHSVTYFKRLYERGVVHYITLH